MCLLYQRRQTLIFACHSKSLSSFFLQKNKRLYEWRPKLLSEEIASKMKTARLLFLVLSLLSVEVFSEIRDHGYDPLAAAERPKMFVDYINGPLKGKKKDILLLYLDEI